MSQHTPAYVPGGPQFPISLLNDTTHVGFTGAMYLQSDTLTKCPRTTAEWRAAAPKLRLTSSPSPFVYAPLEVFPPMLQAGVFGLPLNFSNLAINLTLGPDGRAPPTAAGVPMRVDAEVVNGFSFSNTSYTGGAKLDTMRDQTYVGSNLATFKVGLAAAGCVFSVGVRRPGRARQLTSPATLLASGGRWQEWKLPGSCATPVQHELLWQHLGYHHHQRLWRDPLQV